MSEQQALPPRSEPRPVLPPGQRAVAGFPRFGAQRGGPPRAPAGEQAIEVRGPLVDPRDVSLGALDTLSRVEVTADHHCVAGWSALGLRWSGFPFPEVYERVIAPTLRPGTTVTHLAFTGLDGYRSIVRLDDLIQPRVLLADRLDGAPLDGRHGAPIRLVSPDQYGFVGTKHLCRVEAYDHEPPAVYHSDRRVDRILHLVRPHERARVWEEERHRHLPSRLARQVYRLAVPLPARPLGPGT